MVEEVGGLEGRWRVASRECEVWEGEEVGRSLGRWREHRSWMVEGLAVACNGEEGKGRPVVGEGRKGDGYLALAREGRDKEKHSPKYQELIQVVGKLFDRVITVEYAVPDDDDNNDDGRRNGYSPNRRGREYSSPDKRGRGRSASPYGRGLERDSPDYGRGPSPYKQPDQRSPKNDRAESPVYVRYRSRSRGSEE